MALELENGMFYLADSGQQHRMRHIYTPSCMCMFLFLVICKQIQYFKHSLSFIDMKVYKQNSQNQ